MDNGNPQIDVAAANEVLRPAPAEERIAWAAQQFGHAAVLLSSMQQTASVLMHMFFTLRLDNEILFGDTGFHFHETLRFRDQLMREYRLNIVSMYPELTPEQQEHKFGKKLHLYIDGQPECCRLRKEEPFLAHMRTYKRRLVMGGLRKTEGHKRGKLEPLAKDPRIGGYALSPIYDWSDEQVAAYLKDNNVPLHPLHAQSFPSIGCECCTTPVALGEDPRAGRWRHLREPGVEGPLYCGINFTDGSGI